MKILNLGIISALLLSSSALFAQGELDAYRYSKSDLNGTARYLGMGGAFGALGGDISAMSSNPGGLAIYRSSEVVTSMSFSSVQTETKWSSVMKAKENTFNFDNIAYVSYFPTANSSGIMSWNVGFAYNRVNSFDRNYTTQGSGNNYQMYSLADYIGARAYGTKLGTLEGSTSSLATDPYNNADWLTVLGYEGGLISPINSQNSQNIDYTSAFYDVDENNEEVYYSPSNTKLNVQERGSTDKYDFSAATNISDFLFIGATLSVTDISYRTSTTYDEEFESINSNLYLDNESNTYGTGLGVNIGAIIRPTDFLRFGVAFNSPTWYRMTEYSKASAGSDISFYKPSKVNADTPDDGYWNYELRTPEKWIFSAAGIFKHALISVDYELTNYNSMKLYTDRGEELTGVNGDIQADFGIESLLKVGGEIKVTPQFSVRAGYALRSSAVKQDLEDNTVEVITEGTIPHYTIDKGTQYYTIGLGYRFSPRFYTDIAYVYQVKDESLKLFSNIYDGDGTALVNSDPIDLSTKTTRLALTLGYKF
jgi:hypothetical protein